MNQINCTQRQIVANVTRRYAAVVDKATLEKWKKDLRMMTKIYRDIPLDFGWDDQEAAEKAKDYFKEAWTLFNRFRDEFTDWVYKVVLPKRERDKDTYLEKSVKKSAWDFRYTISILFPTMYGNIPDLAKLRNERDRNIKRYQVAATKAFKDLGEYLDSQGGGPLIRHDQVDHFEVGGVPVILENFGRDGDETTEKELYTALNQLKKRFDVVRGAGFGEALKGLTVTFKFDQREALTNGMYNPETDTLTLFPLGLAGSDAGKGTLVHEIGHRFWFKALPGQARAHWEQVLANRGVTITKDDIYRFVQLISNKIDPKNPKEFNDDRKLLSVVLPAAKSETEELKFKELASFPVVPWDATSFDESRYRDFLMGWEGEIVQVEEISEYGDTSPIEGFAECFRIWILKGPRALGPWTREFFVTVCRAGGAKLAKALSPEPS